VAVGLVILIALVESRYLRPYDLSIKLRVWMPLVMAAVGQTFIILGGGIDLSAGTMIAMINVATVRTLTALGGGPGAVAAGVAASLILALAAGAFNGFVVGFLRIQPIIATFATGVLWQGMALWIMPESGGEVPMAVYDVYAGRFLFLPSSVWMLFLLLLLFRLVVGSRFYTRLKAVGGNITGAYESGVPVVRIRIASYMIGAAFFAVAAWLIVGETITGNPLAGQGYELESIASAVIGGTALAGGFGAPLGSVFGAFVMKLVNDMIFFFGIPVTFQRLMQGVIILAALAGGAVLTGATKRTRSAR
jgi:ribose transport system permease protein